MTSTVARSTTGTAAIASASHATPVLRRAVGGRLGHLLGSMKLSVWLLLLLAALTWLGTLAQTDRSTHDVQREYFESWFVVAKLPLSFWGRALWLGDDGQPFPLRIPLPGAYPVLALLFVNLIVGGLVRMQWRARNAGILITHVGIASLLFAGFVKLHYSYAGSLSLYESPVDGNRLPGRVYESSRFVSFHDDELALLIDHGDTIEERVVPEQRLWAARGEGSVTLTAADLPFSVQVRHWIDHARALPKGPNVQTRMPVVDGVFLQQQSWPVGEQPKSENEFSGCYVTIFGKDKERFESILLCSPGMPFDDGRYPFAFTLEGRRYGLELRRVTRDLPFVVRLDKFQKLDHPGTISPRDFRSFVSVLDGAVTQEAQVFMNNPLRRGGFVVYQTGWGPQRAGVPAGGPPWYSTFEVSYNPSDLWPAIACIVIWIGLFLHFLLKLHRFLKSSARTSLQA